MFNRTLFSLFALLRSIIRMQFLALIDQAFVSLRTHRCSLRRMKKLTMDTDAGRSILATWTTRFMVTRTEEVLALCILVTQRVLKIARLIPAGKSVHTRRVQQMTRFSNAIRTRGTRLTSRRWVSQWTVVVATIYPNITLLIVGVARRRILVRCRINRSVERVVRIAFRILALLPILAHTPTGGMNVAAVAVEAFDTESAFGR